MIALITDQHIGAKSFNKAIFNNQMDFFEKQFFPYLIKNKIKNVISLGDLAHNRNTIDLWILQELKQRFFKWFDDNDIKLHLIMGNHDAYFKNTGSHSFLHENVKEYKNITEYIEPQTIIIDKYTIGMIPWNFEDKYEFPEKCDIICGHFEMKDFPMNNKTQYSLDGIDASNFSKYKMVFSGHYHSRSNKGNIYYIGSPYQISWGDFSEPKGFAVLEQNYKLKFIENTITPKFLKVYVSENSEEMSFGVSGLGDVQYVSQKELVELNKNHYIKIITNGIKNQINFDQLYIQLAQESKNGNKIETMDSNEVIEEINFDEIAHDISGNENLFTMLSNYVDEIKFDEAIDKDLLLNLIKQLHSESFDVVG